MGIYLPSITVQNDCDTPVKAPKAKLPTDFQLYLLGVSIRALHLLLKLSAYRSTVFL